MKLVDVGALLALVAMAVGILGLVGLIKPKIFFGASTRKRVALGILGAFVLFIAGTAIVGTNSKGDPKAPTTAVAASTPKAAGPVQPVSQAKAAVPALPNDQAQFVVAVSDARRAYREAKNEMAQGGTRATRRSALCAALKGPLVQSWIGTITNVSSANDGRGVLSVKIADSFVLTTWNNSLSDMGADTLIEPGSTVFKTAVDLRKGDIVQFSGSLFPDMDDCVKETSMTLHGSMTDPGFLIRFTTLKKL